MTWKHFRMIGLWTVVYAMLYACQADGYVQKAQYVTNGQQLYRTHCQNCHGAQGEGLGTLYPALTDTNRLAEIRLKMPRLVRFGTETISIDTTLIQQKMPANPVLTSIEIAYVLTYIQNAFGNEMNVFSHEEVQALLR